MDIDLPDKDRCIKEFMADPYSQGKRRCKMKSGYGPHRLYCQRCAVMIEAAWKPLPQEGR